MAERRMFAKTIIDSDAFLDMPLSAQALYFHLSMRADDEGFINNPRKIQRMIGASDDDLRLLIAKKFLIAFDTGVVVIKHWRIHNYIQKDRYTETVYQEERAQLMLKENKAYSLADPVCIQDGYSLDTDCIHDGYSLDTQDRLGKDRLGKDNNNAPTRESRFIPPTIDEVRIYCQERGNNIDPEQFVAFYESKGWMIGKNKMKDWKAAVITWEKDRSQKTKQTAFRNYDERNTDYEALFGASV